jgi:hypothetical protein
MGGDGTGTAVTLTDLTPSTEYEVVATAYNAEGRGEITKAIYITTADP